EARKHLRIVGLDLVLVALVAPRLHVGDRAGVILLAELVAAERVVEPLVAPAVARLGDLPGARERLGARRPGLGAAEDDVGEDLGAAAALGERSPRLLRLRGPALAERDQRGPRAGPPAGLP